MNEIDRAIAVLEYAGRADLAKAIVEQAREIAALKEIQQDVIDGAMSDLSDQVKEQAREIGRLRGELDTMIEREAGVCPEDVGCDEYIPQLERQLAKCHERTKALEKAGEALLIYEEAMDGADGCGENEDLYWQAVKLIRAAIRPAKKAKEEKDD